jgi:anion-transporting  ArsA/GET3 family ATPase
MLEKELLVVTGKGGVGKSSVAAALGAAAARHRRTLVLEVDPRENVHQMLGAPPSGGDIVPISSGLWLQNLSPLRVVDQIVRDRVPIELLVRRVLASPVYKQFAQGAPGLKELAVLGRALEIVKGRVREAPEIDLVILDAPATGHGVSLLAAPQLVAEAIGRGPVAEMTREVSEWVSSDEDTGIVVVTLAEEMPVSEALELIEILEQRFDRRPDLAVVNQLYPRLPAGFEARDALGRLWKSRRELNDEELARFTASWNGPLGELPLYPLERGPDLVAELADGLSPWLEGVPA